MKVKKEPTCRNCGKVVCICDTFPDRLTQSEVDAINESTYNKILSDLMGRPATFEDEKEFYLTKGKPTKTYNRTVAIKKHCQECANQENSIKVACDVKWGKYYSEIFPEGCAFNCWIGNVRYIPKKAKKVTQKSAIKWRCKWCQGGGNSAKYVRDCTAFLYTDENGIEQGCHLHPWRNGSNPWYGTNMTEEQKEALRTRMEKYRKSKQQGDK